MIPFSLRLIEVVAKTFCILLEVITIFQFYFGQYVFSEINNFAALYA